MTTSAVVQPTTVSERKKAQLKRPMPATSATSTPIAIPDARLVSMYQDCWSMDLATIAGVYAELCRY